MIFWSGDRVYICDGIDDYRWGLYILRWMGGCIYRI